MCEIEVTISFLMLASVTTRAAMGFEEIQRTISSSSWLHFLLEFSTFLLVKLNEKRLEKESTIRFPGENSGLIGEKDGKIPSNLEWASFK